MGERHPIMQALVAAQGRRHRLVLPEVVDDDGAAVPIYVRQLTLAERDKLLQLLQAGDRGEAHYNAEIAIRCAEDKEGNAIFRKEDKPALMRSVGMVAVAKIAYAATHAVPLEDAEKN